jgi:hypothetical protein
MKLVYSWHFAEPAPFKTFAIAIVDPGIGRRHSGKGLNNIWLCCIAWPGKITG